MDAELKGAIEGLYRIFERYPLRPSTEPCLHCHEPDEERVLHEHLLRELSAEDLSGYAGEALAPNVPSAHVDPIRVTRKSRPTDRVRHPD